MKQKFLLMICGVIFFAGCGGGDDAGNGNRGANAGNAANQAANAPATNTNSNANANANANSTGNSVVVQKQLAIKRIETPEEVKFEAGALPEEWQWFDPDGKNNPTKYDTSGGFLRLEVPSGKDLYGDTQTAPRLTKVVEGDFEIETRVKFEPQTSYQGAGILIWRDEKNYLRLERGKGGIDAEVDVSGIRFDKSENGNFASISPVGKNLTVANVVELKIRRAGEEYTAFWREPNGGEWKEVAKFAGNFGNPMTLGLIVCNTAQPMAAEFAYIKLAPVAK